MKNYSVVVAILLTFFWGVSFSQNDLGAKFGSPVRGGNTQFSNNGFSLEGDPQAQKGWDALRKKIYNKEMITISDVKGSPYSNDNFLPATLMYDGQIEKECFARYDAYNDEVEFKEFNKENAERYALLKSANLSCRIGNDNYFYLPYFEKGVLKAGYMAKQFEGSRYWFYARDKKTIKEKKTATTSLHKTFPARFSETKEFFIGEPNKKLIQVPNSKKRILSALIKSDQQKAKKFIKEHKLDLKSEEQVIKLLKYLDQ
ncbi:hypothetical protein ACFQ1M_01100 [Sungkyunkwania multivorans]|uniref:Uncharacterized protein n=1 Tax=Sungkyunkwania multivorans TaxID=1173618 RepID=A0ABW3CSP5_9FLAO